MKFKLNLNLRMYEPANVSSGLLQGSAYDKRGSVFDSTYNQGAGLGFSDNYNLKHSKTEKTGSLTRGISN